MPDDQSSSFESLLGFKPTTTPQPASGGKPSLEGILGFKPQGAGSAATPVSQPKPAFEAPKIPDLKDRPPLKLAPEEEQKFQSFVKGTQWHKEFQPRYGEEP